MNIEKRIHLKVNDEFSMEVSTHFTSGYQWIIKEYDNSIIQVSFRNKEFNACNIAELPIGKSSSTNLIIRGINYGETELIIYEKRKWEKESKYINKMHFVVIVE